MRNYSHTTSTYNRPYNSYGRTGFNMDVFLFLLVMVIVFKSPLIVEWIVRLLGL